MIQRVLGTIVFLGFSTNGLATVLPASSPCLRKMETNQVTSERVGATLVIQARNIESNLERAEWLKALLIDAATEEGTRLGKDMRLSPFPVVLSEMVTNAYKHGNRESPTKTFDVRVELGEQRIELLVVDQGEEPFDPNYNPHAYNGGDPLEHQNVRDGLVASGKVNGGVMCGRGLFLIRELTDEATYRFKAGAEFSISMPWLMKPLSDALPPLFQILPESE